MESLDAKKKIQESEEKLYQEALSGKKKFLSKEVAIASLSKELEELSAKAGKSVDEILKLRESSATFVQSHERVAVIVRQLAALKNNG